MNQKHLLRFIKAKLKKNSSDIVMHRDGQDLTLQGVFDSLGLTSYDLSIDTLDMHVRGLFSFFFFYLFIFFCLAFVSILLTFLFRPPIPGPQGQLPEI